MCLFPVSNISGPASDGVVVDEGCRAACICVASLLLIFGVACQPKNEGAARKDSQISRDQYLASLHAKAIAGDPAAQFDLAGLYGLGQGVPQDFAQVANWSRKAAEQGHAGGQHLQGTCYLLGKGIPQNSLEAVKWFRKAADQGNALGEYNLAVCLTEGNGIPQNYAEAMKWSRKAADQGNSGGQFLVGALYGLGNGVPQSYEEAYVWSSLAAAGKHKAAITFRDTVATKLCPSALERAQARARKLHCEIQERMSER